MHVFFHVSADPSAPGISVTQISLTAANIELTPPLVGTECLSGYRVEYDGVSRSTGTSTSVVIRDLELCFKEYHFTAFGVTPGHLNGTRSRSMSLGSGKRLIMYLLFLMIRSKPVPFLFCQYVAMVSTIAK